MNKQLIFDQGIIEIFLLILDLRPKLILYRLSMLYFAFKNDEQSYSKTNKITQQKKQKIHLGLQQIIVTICFFILNNGSFDIIKEFIIFLIMHLIIYQYPQTFTFCESYTLASYIIDYYQLKNIQMFGYLSELVLILAFISYFIIIIAQKIPIKELAFAITFIALLKINFFSIYYYLEYKGDSLKILINEIIDEEFRTYFFIQFLSLLLIIPISFIKGKKIILRKLFHFQISIIIIIGLYLNINYTKLALSVFIWLFLVLEGLRQIYKNDIIFIKSYSQFLLKFCDQRDSDKVIKSHLYLLMGISHCIFNNNDPYSGIILLGFGDSMAAIVGSSIGKHKYPNSQRTIEGSLAFLISCTILDYCFNQKIRIWLIQTFIEAYTSQIDNLILPKLQLNPILNKYLC